MKSLDLESPSPIGCNYTSALWKPHKHDTEFPVTLMPERHFFMLSTAYTAVRLTLNLQLYGLRRGRS